MSLTKLFLDRAAKTDLFLSHQEERLRYKNPPRQGSDNLKRWLLLDLASRWEWLPRLNWMTKEKD